VVVVAPDVVVHTITGSDAVTIGPDVVVVKADDVVVVDELAAEVDVVECFGWEVLEDVPDPDEPHAATPSAHASTTPTTPSQ
jgi:hypothetical protein